jgi:hypothetical protein
LAGFVQSTSNSGTGASLTLTFGTATSYGNSVVIAACGYYLGSIASITLGGTGGIFSKVATSSGVNAEIWAAYDVNESSTSLILNTSSTGIIAWAYEVNGTVALDVNAGAYTAGSYAWNSGTTSSSIPYDHFAVGLGYVLDNAGAITPLTAGWTNETSYTNIAGAGPYAIGGVSGWTQTGGSSATFVYAGDSADYSDAGAVTAAFLATGPPSRTDPVWGGYVFSEHASYNGVTATFELPESIPVNAEAIVSVWVGIGTLYQFGIYLQSNSGDTGNVSTSPWTYFILPWSGESWSEGSYPAGAGDSLTLSLSLSAQYLYMTMKSSTRGWTYTEAKSIAGLNLNSWNMSGSEGAGTPVSPSWFWPASSVQVIIEREDTDVVDYGSITFTGVTTTPGITTEPEAVFTVGAGTTIDQYPGSFNLGGSAFTMYWNGYT